MMIRYDIYDIMGVTKNDLTALKYNFRKLSIKYHPDKNGGIINNNYELILLAYKILNDDNLRALYDETKKHYVMDFFALKKTSQDYITCDVNINDNNNEDISFTNDIHFANNDKQTYADISEVYDNYNDDKKYANNNDDINTLYKEILETYKQS